MLPAAGTVAPDKGSCARRQRAAINEAITTRIRAILKKFYRALTEMATRQAIGRNATIINLRLETNTMGYIYFCPTYSLRFSHFFEDAMQKFVKAGILSAARHTRWHHLIVG